MSGTEAEHSSNLQTSTSVDTTFTLAMSTRKSDSYAGDQAPASQDPNESPYGVLEPPNGQSVVAKSNRNLGNKDAIMGTNMPALSAGAGATRPSGQQPQTQVQSDDDDKHQHDQTNTSAVMTKEEKTVAIKEEKTPQLSPFTYSQSGVSLRKDNSKHQAVQEILDGCVCTQWKDADAKQVKAQGKKQVQNVRDRHNALLRYTRKYGPATPGTFRKLTFVPCRQTGGASHNGIFVYIMGLQGAVLTVILSREQKRVADRILLPFDIRTRDDLPEYRSGLEAIIRYAHGLAMVYEPLSLPDNDPRNRHATDAFARVSIESAEESFTQCLRNCTDDDQRRAFAERLKTAAGKFGYGDLIDPDALPNQAVASLPGVPSLTDQPGTVLDPVDNVADVRSASKQDSASIGRKRPAGNGNNESPPRAKKQKQSIERTLGEDTEARVKAEPVEDEDDDDLV